MSEIIQELGFDASQALATLRQLDGAFGTLQKNLNGVAGAASAFNKIGSQSKQLTQISANVAQATRSVEKLTTSFGLLSRIVFTQAVIKGLRIVQSSLGDATKAAADFQKQISLIRTIDDSGASFDRIGASLRGLSDELNIDLKDVGAGVFQAISNQIGTQGDCTIT